MEKKIIIGTRGSALALEQAAIVGRALLCLDPTYELETRIITTEGDVNFEPIPLDTIGKGWFTKEIEQSLLDGAVDLAVHSLKDLAEELPNGLCIAAYLPREDARDALVTKGNLSLGELPQGAVVGTDSMRRQMQMLLLRPDVIMQSLRGNVLTRLTKLDSGEYDAIILAVAGLKRLGEEGRIAHYFEPHEMTPAPGQGILAIEVRQSDQRLLELLAQVNDASASRAAKTERTFSKKVGGGCKSPTGAFFSEAGGVCRLLGAIATKDGCMVRDEMQSTLESCEELGELLAHKMLREQLQYA